MLPAHPPSTSHNQFFRPRSEGASLCHPPSEFANPQSPPSQHPLKLLSTTSMCVAPPQQPLRLPLFNTSPPSLDALWESGSTPTESTVRWAAPCRVLPHSSLLALIIYDDLLTQAVAYRQMSLFVLSTQDVTYCQMSLLRPVDASCRSPPNDPPSSSSSQL